MRRFFIIACVTALIMTGCGNDAGASESTVQATTENSSLVTQESCIPEKSVLWMEDDENAAKLMAEINAGVIPSQANVLYDQMGSLPDVTVTDPNTILELYNRLALMTVAGESNTSITDCYHHINFRLRDGSWVSWSFEGEGLLSRGRTNFEVKDEGNLWPYVRGLQDEKMNEEAVQGDLPPMVRIDGILYQDTGYVSSAVGCGTMDGEIMDAVDGSEVPTEDNQSNFGTGFGWQRSSEGQVIVVMNDEWRIFRDPEHHFVSDLPEEVLNFSAKVLEVRENSLLVSFIDAPEIFIPPVTGECEVPADGCNLAEDIAAGDIIRVWCDGSVEEVYPPILGNVYRILKEDEEAPEDLTGVIDLGTSEIFSSADRQAAADLILKEFDGWDGCELHKLWFTFDDQCNAENIKWINDLAKGQGLKPDFTECIQFKSNYHSPADPNRSGAWNPDEEYMDWEWWLARTEGGEWHLMTWGY